MRRAEGREGTLSGAASKWDAADDRLAARGCYGPWVRYCLAVAGGNLVWEFLHMPFYTLWRTGTWREIIVAAVHCTGGDILIAMSCLVIALFLVGGNDWPDTKFRAVAAITIVLGVAVTAFLEWLNVIVRAAWAYSELMPVFPLFGFQIGVSPLLQWIVVPAAALTWVRYSARRRYKASHLCGAPGRLTV